MGKQLFTNAKRSVIFMMRPQDLIVVTDKAHPLYDERVELPLDERLVTSISARGVINPIVVRRNPDGKAEVVDGRQRARAAQEVVKRFKKAILVPCVNRPGEDTDLVGTSVAANEIRQSDPVLLKARKAARLINLGSTEEQVAIDFGVSTTAVRQWLELLSAPAEVRKAVAAGEITATHAMALAKRPAEEQKKALAEAAEVAAAKKEKTGGGAPRAKAKSTARHQMRSYREVKDRLELKNLEPNYKKALLWVLRLD